MQHSGVTLSEAGVGLVKGKMTSVNLLARLCFLFSSLTKQSADIPEKSDLKGETEAGDRTFVN